MQDARIVGPVLSAMSQSGMLATIATLLLLDYYRGLKGWMIK